jgi:hypothetical protein
VKREISKSKKEKKNENNFERKNKNVLSYFDVELPSTLLLVRFLISPSSSLSSSSSPYTTGSKEGIDISGTGFSLSTPLPSKGVVSSSPSSFSSSSNTPLDIDKEIISQLNLGELFKKSSSSSSFASSSSTISKSAGLLLTESDSEYVVDVEKWMFENFILLKVFFFA